MEAKYARSRAASPPGPPAAMPWPRSQQMACARSMGTASGRIEVMPRFSGIAHAAPRSSRAAVPPTRRFVLIDFPARSRREMRRPSYKFDLIAGILGLQPVDAHATHATAGGLE